MEYQAVTKNVKVSPRKVRLVADSVRDLTIPQAITALLVSRKRGAPSIKKTLESAIANAVNNKSAKKDDLKIKTINITEGIMYKRYHFAGRGRTRPYTKRTSHINVVLEDNITMQMPIMPEVEKVEVKKEISKVSKEKKPAVVKTLADKGGKK